MKRFLAVFAGLAALVILSSFFLRDIGSIPQPATEVVTAAQPDGRLQLELSRRLASPPIQDGLPVTDTWIGRTIEATRSALTPFSQLNARQSRSLVYLLGATLVGLLLGLASRRQLRATPAAQTVAAQDPGLITRLRAELEERNDAIHDLEKVMEKRASKTAETLNMPLQERLAQHEQTISIIAEDLAARDARIATQSAELEEKTYRLRDLENEVAGLGERDQPLERRLGQQGREITELEQELSTRRSEVIALQEELSASRSRCETLESQRNEMHEQLETASSRDAELDESQKRLAERDAELSIWKDSVGTLEKEIEHRAETIERLEEDLEVSEKQLGSIRVERDGLSDTMTILQARIDDRQRQFESERQRLQAQIDELDSELDQRTRQLGFVDETQAERDTVAEELRREIEADQQQIIGLETELGDLHSQKEKMTSWQSTLQTYKSDLRARDGIIDALRDDVSCLADTEQQVLDQQETIAELESELDKQKTLAQTLKAGVDRLREFKDLAEQRERDLELLNDELQSTRLESEEWRDRIAPLEETVRLRDAEIERLQLETQANTREMQELEEELADWRVKMTAMESGLRERDAGLDDLRSELESGRSQVLELNQLEPQLEQTRTDLATVKQQFEFEVQAREELESELADLREVEEKLAAWDSTVTTLREDLRARERALDTVLDDFSVLVGGKVSVVGWSAAVNDVKSTLDERDREGKQLRTEIERLELQAAESESLRHQLDEHQTDLAAMRSELEKTQGAVQFADQAEITLQKNRETIAQLENADKEKTRRIDDLEMDAVEWINKHAALNSRYECQNQKLNELETEISHLHERFEAQRQTILKMRADKLGQDNVDELPTLTTVVKPGAS